MDYLHLTYTETFEVIPYRNLLLFSKDKQHVVTGSKVNKTTGKDMMARRRNGRKKKKKGE